MNPRRAEVEIEYQGLNITSTISQFMTSFSYTDNGTGQADDLQLTLEDREGNWRKPWLPKDGDRIKAKINLPSWENSGKTLYLNCGVFAVDSVNFSGPPETVAIKAASLPANSKLKNERSTKAWEKVSLSQIARKIAAAAGMKVMMETQDVKFDRLDQTEQTGIGFLEEVASKEGVSVKVTNDTIVLFDDRKYESMPPVRSIKRGESNLKSHNFDLSTTDAAYAACTITYLMTKKKKKTTITGTYRIPGKTGPTLKLNERVASAAEATKKAQKALRNKNKEAEKASLTLMGDPSLMQGVTITVAGFGAFDGKYIIDSANHMIGNGYETRIEIRKVLGY
ncbi:late control protein [Paenibacillaceae bacterium]|nr:late control protein [Paenibacillaceae bacterium]